MASYSNFDEAQASKIEDLLFSLSRQQSNRKLPVDLPIPKFWHVVAELLNGMEAERRHMLKNNMMGVKFDSLQKRQQNIRRVSAEFMRRRIVAMVEHVGTLELKPSTHKGMNNDIPTMDWGKADPMERAFYGHIREEIVKFKRNVNWEMMQRGLEGELDIPEVIHPKGTTQLADYSSGMANKPQLVIQEEFVSPPLAAFDDDVEEEIHEPREPEFLDIDEYIHADLIDQQSSSSPDISIGKSSIAMELAPSKSKKSFDDFLDEAEEREPAVLNPDQKVGSQSNTESSAGEVEMLRIKVLEDAEGITDANGNEISLQIGDVQNLPKEDAEWLIDAGMAKLAPL